MTPQLDLKMLRELAEKAKENLKYDWYFLIEDVGDDYNLSTPVNNFITEASPQTMLKLLDLIDELKEFLENSEHIKNCDLNNIDGKIECDCGLEKLLEHIN